MAKLKVTRSCQNCGQDFVGWTGNANSYCSTNCYHSDKGPAIQRFKQRIDKNGPVPNHRPELGPCWVWIGKLSTAGYGKSGLGPAHRVSWEIYNGPIPKHLWVLHRCDNPPCVRPDHLFLGTNRDNNADMVAKNRSPWGSRHPNAVLTEEIVREARRLYVPQKFGCRKVAEKLGFPEPGIRAAIQRVTWTHI